MAYCELADIDTASFDFADIDDVPLGEEDATTDVLIERGLIYASGRSVAADLVTAHMWFNIAAMRGDKEAARLRREIAAEMSDAEIGAAQRAARDWLKQHPQAPERMPELRAAA
jgi:TPR repeat protein